MKVRYKRRKRQRDRSGWRHTRTATEGLLQLFAQIVAREVRELPAAGVADAVPQPALEQVAM